MKVNSSSKPGDRVLTNAFSSRPDVVLNPNVWEMIAVDLKVSDDGQVVYKGEKLMVEVKNPLTAPTLRKGSIKI